MTTTPHTTPSVLTLNTLNAMKQSLNPTPARLITGFTVLIERVALALRGALRTA